MALLKDLVPGTRSRGVCQFLVAHPGMLCLGSMYKTLRCPITNVVLPHPSGLPWAPHHEDQPYKAVWKSK